MNLAFDTRIFILVCCLLQGLAGLRLIKVSIPAYKLRGESTFLECQYELNKSKGLYGGVHRSRNHQSYGHHQHHQYRQHGGTGGTNGNYDDHEGTYDTYRRMRTQQQQQLHQQQQHQQQQHQQHQYQQQSQRQPYFQPLVQAYQAQWHDGGSSSSSSSSSNSGSSSTGSSGSYYQHEQQQQGYGYERQYNPEYPTLPPSPYGHSVYRGRSQSSSTSLTSSLSSSSTSNHNSNYGGRVGASTYTGKTYTSTGGFPTSYGHHPEHDDDSIADSNERNEHMEDIEDMHEENETNSAEGDGDDDDEEGEDLYAIKWYKDNEEFYRFVPKANPPKTSYRVDGIRVIEEHSDSSRVLLRGLAINSTGLYRCEISAEAPNFSSVQGEGQMDIVYLPRDGPHIKGQQFQYQIGETLNLNCTSGKSHPASHLQWFINDQAVVDGQYLIRYNDTVHRHGLITSTLGLEMTVDARHFNNGAMRVKCLASISPVLWKGGKESVLQRRPGIIDNREAMLLVRSSSNSIHRHHNQHGGHKALTALRVLTTAAILMKLCQLLLLHREFT